MRWESIQYVVSDELGTLRGLNFGETRELLLKIGLQTRREKIFSLHRGHMFAKK